MALMVNEMSKRGSAAGHNCWHRLSAFRSSRTRQASQVKLQSHDRRRAVIVSQLQEVRSSFQNNNLPPNEDETNCCAMPRVCGHSPARSWICPNRRNECTMRLILAAPTQPALGTRSMGKKVPNSKRNQPASSSACVVFIIAIARPI